MRFSELADKWLASRKGHMEASTFTTTTTLVASLKSRFGGKVAREITARHVADWSAERQKEKTRLGGVLSPRRFNYEVQTLKLIFRYGVSPLRVILDNPSFDLKRRPLARFVKDTPTVDQFRSLVAELRAEPKSKVYGGAADLTELLAYCGARVGAIPYLTWQHVDFENGMITLRNEKERGGGRDYRVPLNPALRALLVRLRAAVPNARDTDRIIRINNAKKSLEGACKRAKLPDFTHHALRHFFASNAVGAGIDFRTIAEWLDHHDGGFLVAKTYAHVRAVHSRAQAQKMTITATT